MSGVGLGSVTDLTPVIDGNTGADADFRRNARARVDEIIFDITSHEDAHGLSVRHPGDLPNLRVIDYPTDYTGTGKATYIRRRRFEGGPVTCHMRYKFTDIRAAIAGDLDKDGDPNEPGESPDRDWTPTVPDSTGYCAVKLREVILDDADE